MGGSSLTVHMSTPLEDRHYEEPLMFCEALDRAEIADFAGFTEFETLNKITGPILKVLTYSVGY